MDRVEIVQEEKEISGIEKLMSLFEEVRHSARRLTNKDVSRIFRQIRHEIPYALVVPLALIESLLVDTPQNQTNLTLNEVIANLGKVLCNPHQKEDLSYLVKTYLHNRKKTVQAYAAVIAGEIVEKHDLHQFPERSKPALNELAQLIIEKVIHEKQSRTIPGYRLQPLIELAEPFIYHRLFDPELERVRESHRLAFKKFVNAIAQDGYDKASDDKKLMLIQQEKEAAFRIFQQSISKKVSVLINIGDLQHKISYVQHDKRQKLALLKKEIDIFLKPIDTKKGMRYLSQELRVRLAERLHKALFHADQDSHIYDSEEKIKQAHEVAFEEVENDVKIINQLIVIIASIQENYAKNFLHLFAGKKNLNTIQEVMLSVVLGRSVKVSDAITGKERIIRVGGYPQRNIVDIYSNLIMRLSDALKNLHGIFSEALKEEVLRAVENLRAASANLKMVSPTLHAEKEIEIPVLVPISHLEQDIAEVKSSADIPVTPPPLAIQIEPEPEIQQKVEPKPLLDMEDVESVLEPQQQPSLHPKPLLIVEEDVVPEAPPSDQAAIDAGVLIMKNYQLGDFEKPIYQAWKSMVEVAHEHVPDTTTTALPSDNEVRLYVMCDLAQQISSIKVSSLSAQQERALQSVKGRLKEALRNPLDDNNWDCFEGKQRDYIDGVMATLLPPAK